MPNQPSAFFRYAALYSLVIPIWLALLLHIPSLSATPRQKLDTFLFAALLITLSAIIAGIASLFGLRSGTKRQILITAIPGMILGAILAFVLFITGISTMIH